VVVHSAALEHLIQINLRTNPKAWLDLNLGCLHRRRRGRRPLCNFLLRSKESFEISVLLRHLVQTHGCEPIVTLLPRFPLVPLSFERFLDVLLLFKGESRLSFEAFVEIF